MLQLTEAAAVRLKSALEGLRPEEGDCFRIRVTQEGVTIVADHKCSGDITVDYDENVLVVMDAISADRLENLTMDFDEAARRLVFS